ncbi:MAG TPA: menaquinone biosynthesis protein [Longimicrobium sp.]|nr:menaquinone biosynthesis protein [Longimicrobium sp.]
MADTAGERLRLGHIVYSNCFPVHARLLDQGAPGWIEMVEGVPGRLNGLLERGKIDVAPCSSIEFARNADRYRVLPDLVIGSRGPVRSIVFTATRPPRELDGALVAMPTASATSVVLLKVLLRLRWGVRPRFRWFDQAAEDPFAAGADAALFIGDVALRADLHPGVPLRYDLGAEWWDHTGLPFAFAVWQAGGGSDGALRRLHATLLDSRAYGRANRAELAARWAERFGFAPDFLDRYWADLSYELDGPMLEGLATFYRLAAEIGEIPHAPRLRFVPVHDPQPAAR